MGIRIDHLHIGHLSFGCHGGHPDCNPVYFPFTIDNVTVYLERGKVFRMAFTMPVGKRVKLNLPTQGKDKYENIVELATPPVPSVSDSTILAIKEADPNDPVNPNQAYLRSLGRAGMAQLILTEDEGEQPFTAIIDIETKGGPVATIDTSTLLGEIEDDPDFVPPSPTPEPNPDEGGGEVTPTP